MTDLALDSTHLRPVSDQFSLSDSTQKELGNAASFVPKTMA
jgi:hypothetical protein